MGPTHRLDVKDLDAAAALVVLHGGEGALALKRALDDATDLRRVRGAAEYHGESVAPADVGDAIEILRELLAGLPEVVESQLA